MVQALCGSDAPNWSEGGPTPWPHVGGTPPTRSSASSPRATSSWPAAPSSTRSAGTSQIAESTWHRWLAQYGGMKASDAKRLKELEAENIRLKKLLAEAELDKAMLKELAEGNF